MTHINRDIDVILPTRFWQSDFFVNRFGSETDKLHIFTINDVRNDGLPINSDVTIEHISSTIINNGSLGDQHKARIANICYDAPNWEVYAKVDTDAIKVSMDDKRIRLYELLPHIEKRANILKYRVAFVIDELYPNTKGMRFKNLGFRNMNLGRVAGINVGYKFDNWYPNDIGRFAVYARDVICGATCWKFPVTAHRIGSQYWIKNGATKVAAAMFLDEYNLPGVNVFAYCPSLKKKRL